MVSWAQAILAPERQRGRELVAGNRRRRGGRATTNVEQRAARARAAALDNCTGCTLITTVVSQQINN